MEADRLNGLRTHARKEERHKKETLEKIMHGSNGTKLERRSDEKTSAVILQQAYKRENSLLVQQSAPPIVLDSSAQRKIF